MRPTTQLIDAQSGAVLLSRLQLAMTFWSRFRGLQLARRLESNEGLLLAPCHSVHTQFMRFSIDIYFCSSSGEVISRKLNARPWITVATNNKASFVIETTSRTKPLLEVGQEVLLHNAFDQNITFHKCLASMAGR